ncbi:Pentatricopeptide repeat-containing protein [Striga hermonthica]|uniref:Pentatricopeptide repeat-containing protein n=1 Tax=Striga hermonthica TaxID=68872 RepID=A0A9N7RNY8_STRHE|nr:Pentatricopeptide repeat-containing protein [Striga hermonthica]
MAQTMGYLEEFDKERPDPEINGKNTAFIPKNERVQELRVKVKIHDEKIQFRPPPGSTLCAVCANEGNCKVVLSRTKMMNTLVDMGKPQESVSIFNDLIQEGHKPNLRTYNVLVWAWCTEKNMKAAWDLVTEMAALGMGPNVITYNMLATAYIKDGQMREANVILEMARNNVRPNEWTCGIIISGYCKEGRIQDALRFVNKMKDLGIKPNLVIFNLLIKGCLDASGISGIDEVLDLMAKFEVKPDVISFSTIMNAWSEAGYMIKCREVFEDMVRAGIKPNVHAYSILAKGYVWAQELEKAEELLAAMEKARVGPNVVVYTIVISGWCNRGLMVSALTVFGKMVKKGISPNLNTFETLIRGYAKNKLPGKAKEVLQVMEKFGVWPKKSTFGLISQASCGASLADAANRILGSSGNSGMDQEMHEDGLERYYKKKGVKTRDEKIQFHPPLGSTLCAVCANEGNCKVVLSRTKMMNTLVVMGKPQESVSIFNNLIQGHKPNLITYNVLVRAWCTEKNMKAAWDLVSEMAASGVGPDAIT